MASPKKLASAQGASSQQIHFITGSDEAEVKKAATELAAKLAPSDDPFGIETIDGAVGTVDEAVTKIQSTIEALLTIPFFGGGKLVWLKSATFFADSVMGRSESVTSAIERLLQVLSGPLGDGVVCLISAPESDKRRTAYKTLIKIASVQVFDKPDFGWGATEADLVDWVAKRVDEKGLRLDSDAVQLLTARVGTETRQLDTELEKLALAFGPSAVITESNIRDIVPATRAGGIFDLGNAIAKRDLALCVNTLDQLLYQGEKAVGILLAAIVPTMRNLLAVKALMDEHHLQPPAQPQFFAGVLKKLPDSATRHLPRKKDGTINVYPLGLAAASVRRYTLAELRNGFLACAQANRDLVTSRLPDEVVLHRLLVQVVACKSR
jgi:DNA polymerase-3 subunit delta